MITEEIARKILTTIDCGLTEGKGSPEPGKMCVEAAVCYGMGLPHSDSPTCVAPVLRDLKIGLNDRPWSSDLVRAKGLRRLGLIQLGTKDTLDEPEFLRRVQEMLIRKIIPRALRNVAPLVPTHAPALEAAAIRCEQEGTARAAGAAAEATARAAAGAAEAARAATGAAWAAEAAEAATWAAAGAAEATARAAAFDTELALFAEEVVQILITMKSPGAQWLFLTE